MKLPRTISGIDLIALLSKAGYERTRQTGSHVRLTTRVNGEHHVTIPLHDPLRIGTLDGILHDIALHLGIPKAQLITDLFG